MQVGVGEPALIHVDDDFLLQDKLDEFLGEYLTRVNVFWVIDIRLKIGVSPVREVETVLQQSSDSRTSEKVVVLCVKTLTNDFDRSETGF